MASADECFACLSALLEDGPAEGIEQRARAWEPALKATIRWIRDPSTYSKGQIFAIPTAGFPPPFSHAACCMGLRSHRFLLYSATHPSTSVHAAWVSPPAASCPLPPSTLPPTEY